jgi:hypothetical protein
MKTIMAVALFLLTPSTLVRQANQGSASQDMHHQGVDARGDKAMGFSHDKATHHFILYADGGAIEVKTNDAADTATRDQIRMHFTHIAKMFADGDFSIPMLIHQENPPGADVMKQMRDHITYKFEELPQGGRIRITSTDAKAVAGVHKFLVFQIKDHETGDSTAVTKPQ